MSATPTPPPSRTVLIVDDEPAVRTIARAMLSGAGYTITEAGDPAGARAAMQSASQPFDLILLDLSLPGQSGAELISELRAHMPSSPILLISGGPVDDVATLGGDAFLAKPFTRAGLLDAVQRVLAKA